MLNAGAAAAWAQELLVGQPERWAHTCGVARVAAEIAARIPGLDDDLLVAAAWVHDIGYAPALAETGFMSYRNSSHNPSRPGLGTGRPTGDAASR